ncbi:Calcium proton exchanger [Pyrrhoderma noxium]|uniref:Vacuolar calcium ion transporter n=1 Tax=Pyrrhoderma noxium TaxID=2282107 RepID=A0A286UW87_9AGAM|nr:Calcium proton exchanger [Pyrrhoderma noxium]
MSSLPTERTALLESNGAAYSSNGHPSFASRVLHAVKSEGEPSWAASYKYFITSSWLNTLLVFIPLSFISHHLDWDAALRFSFSFLAIVPLAKLLGDATEQLSFKLGPTLSGLLNASFGNAVEIIVGIAALLQDEIRIVQTSMLGSILSNLLLVLGCSFLAGGLKRPENKFNSSGALMSSSLMTLACITLVLPAAYHSSKWKDQIPFGNGEEITKELLTSFSGSDGVTPVRDPAKSGLLTISRGTAILLLFVYVAYLFFQLKTHANFFERSESEHGLEDEEEEHEEQEMNVFAAGTALLIVTIVTSFCADYLVASIEETATRYNIPKTFIGIILLPIVANAAEHVTSVWMAMKNKTELTIGICIGSSIQIATFVVPLLVIVGWISGHELTLFFADFETITLFVSVLLVNMLIMDGASNYMEGLMLVTLYLVIALAYWVS